MADEARRVEAVRHRAVAVATLLSFEAHEMRYSPRRVRLRLERVRDDLAFYEDAVWLEGHSLSADGSPSGRTQVLALRSAVSGALRRGRS